MILDCRHEKIEYDEEYLEDRRERAIEQLGLDFFEEFEEEILNILVNDCVKFTLTNQGGKRLYRITSNNIGEDIAIVIEGEVLAYARISEPIDGVEMQMGIKNAYISEKVAEYFNFE